MALDRSTLWRAAVLQAGAVVVLAVALASLLPHGFFVSWGWIAGPVAWAICALLTARFLSLPPGRVLVGAALAGIPSLLAVLIGVHWLGAAIAVAMFALWCGVLSPRVKPA